MISELNCSPSICLIVAHPSQWSLQEAASQYITKRESLQLPEGVVTFFGLETTTFLGNSCRNSFSRRRGIKRLYWQILCHTYFVRCSCFHSSRLSTCWMFLILMQFVPCTLPFVSHAVHVCICMLRVGRLVQKPCERSWVPATTLWVHGWQQQKEYVSFCIQRWLDTRSQVGCHNTARGGMIS